MDTDDDDDLIYRTDYHDLHAYSDALAVGLTEKGWREANTMGDRLLQEFVVQAGARLTDASRAALADVVTPIAIRFLADVCQFEEEFAELPRHERRAKRGSRLQAKYWLDGSGDLACLAGMQISYNTHLTPSGIIGCLIVVVEARNKTLN